MKDPHTRIVRTRKPVPPTRVLPDRRKSTRDEPEEQGRLCAICGENYTLTEICDRCFEKELSRRKA